jgi:hypothetical protein
MVSKSTSGGPLFERRCKRVTLSNFYMNATNSSKNAESPEIEKPVADTYHGPDGQVLIILVGLIGSGKVN